MRTPILLLAMTLAPHAHAQFWREDFNGPTLDPRWRNDLRHLRYDLAGGQFNPRGFGGGGPAVSLMSRDAGDLTFEFDFRTRVSFADGAAGLLYFQIGSIEFGLDNQIGSFELWTGTGFGLLPISPGTREFRVVGNDNAWSLFVDGAPMVSNRPIRLIGSVVTVGFLGYPQTTTSYFPCSIDYIEIMPVPAPGISAMLIGAPLLFRRRR